MSNKSFLVNGKYFVIKINIINPFLNNHIKLK